MTKPINVVRAAVTYGKRKRFEPRTPEGQRAYDAVTPAESAQDAAAFADGAAWVLDQLRKRLEPRPKTRRRA